MTNQALPTAPSSRGTNGLPIEQPKSWQPPRYQPAAYQPPPQGGPIAPSEQLNIISSMSPEPVVGQPGLPCEDCAPTQPEGWIGGVSLYVLAPKWSGGNAAYVQRTVNGFGAVDRMTTPFNYGVGAAPGLWLAYVTSGGNGVRANLFNFDQISNVTTVNGTNQSTSDPYALGVSGLGIFTVTPGAAFTSHSRLNITSADVEGVKFFSGSNWSMQAAAGVRYASVNQYYSAELGNSGLMDSKHLFSGLGPTISTSARRQIGKSNMGLFGSGRGALVFGSESMQYQQTVAGTSITATQSTNDWGVLPYAEVEFGMDYRMRLAGGRSIVFENAFVGQSWFGAGNSANANALDGTYSTSNLGLFGLRTAVNFSY
jgi:hypothetical protein